MKSKSITKWAEITGQDTGTQSIPDFFNICISLTGEAVTPAKRELFAKNMWKKGKKRLAIGLRVEVSGIRNHVTEHMIEMLGKDYFIDETGENIPYYKIRRIVTIPEKPKYSMKNIHVGMKLRLVNKNFTGNVYTVTAVHPTGFDAKNIKQGNLFTDLEYSSIDKILK